VICLLHLIRDTAKKEKSPRPVGASGVKFLSSMILNTNYLKKIPLLISLKKNRKNFPLLISLKKQSKNISTADFIEKNSKKNSTADFIEKKICDILPHISGGKKKSQILSKFRW
jgi:hypothetical protein